jgi:hypothetical protein
LLRWGLRSNCGITSRRRIRCRRRILAITCLMLFPIHQLHEFVTFGAFFCSCTTYFLMLLKLEELDVQLAIFTFDESLQTLCRLMR